MTKLNMIQLTKYLGETFSIDKTSIFNTIDLFRNFINENKRLLYIYNFIIVDHYNVILRYTFLDD